MPAGRDHLDGNERFRLILTNGNPKVLGALLSELGDAEAKQVIDECYRSEKDSALIHCVRKAGDGKNKKDKEFIECCALLIKYGADLSEADEAGKTALLWAAEIRNETLVTKLLDSGADPWVKDNKGRNSLHLAVFSGSVECVNIILKHCKDSNKLLNETDNEGVSPIIATVQKGNADILSVLVTSGADVNIQEKETKRTPLHYALYIKRRDLFEYLLENGASITKTDHRGTNILHRCCAIPEPLFLQNVILKNDSSLKKALKMEDGEGATPVIVACQNGNIEQLRQLDEAEAPLTSRDKFKRCALHHCVENTNTECAELLLRSAPSLVNAADEEGLTPLHMAVIAGNGPLIELLMTKGASLSATDNENHSVTHWATVCGHKSVLDILLQHGAKLSTPDKYSAYPIHYASQMMAGRATDNEGSSSGSEGGSIQILRTLLKHKVSTEVEDKDKRTPIIWAASAGNSEACRILKEHGADVNRSDKDDLTALHCAASRGHTDCVDTLVRRCKADIDPVDKNQCTPLFYATTLGHVSTMKSLLDLGASYSHRDTRNRTVAHCATVNGTTEVLDVLKDYKVDLWNKNLKGDQPLHEAAQSGHIDVVQYLLSQPGNDSQNIINCCNQDGRTCLHIAALTNNVWLCNVLLEKGANVNAIMSNKGKYYTPYDAAIIKGFSEAKDILRNHGGVPGTEVSNHAATTIQTRYKYHKKTQRRKEAKEQEETSAKEEEDVAVEKEDVAVEKEKTKDVEKEQKSSKTKEKSPEKSKESKKDKKLNKDNKTAVAATVDEGENEDEKPVYVERSTQVSTVAPGVLVGTGESTEDEPSEKENRARPQSSKKRDSGKSKSNSEKEKASVVTPVKSPAKKPAGEEEKPEEDNKKKEEKHSDDEDDLTSDRSSSHGNTSDIDSVDSSIQQRPRKSPVARNKFKNGDTKVPPLDLEEDQSSPKPSSDKSENDSKSKKNNKVPENKKFSKEPTSTTKNSKKSGKNSSTVSHTHGKKDNDLGEKNKPSKQIKDSVKKSEDTANSDSDSARKSDKSSSAEEGMGSLFSKQRKVGATKTVMPAKKEPAPQKENGGDNVKKIRDEYTDNEYSDVEEDNAHQSPRRKKTRPNKLISRIQESVRRYEEERKSIRRLHQIRRAQIYSAPMYDVSLFKAIMENSQSSQGTPVSNATNWDDYLQEQIKIIKDERRAARKLNDKEQSSENASQSQSTDNARKERRLLEREPTEQRIKKTGTFSRSTTHSEEPPVRTKSNLSKTSPGMARGGRQDRAQTAFGTRTTTPKSGVNRSPKGDSLQNRHEEQQRQLRHAYRPFGLLHTINGSPSQPRPTTSFTPRPMTTGQVRPMSTTSSKTGSTSGSTASVRRRAPTYTIMTPYGSRRLREPLESPKIADPSISSTRKRQPLIFQDPDEYERKHNRSNTHSDIPEENGIQ